MDGWRLDYCARRLNYCHCRIRPLGRASELLDAFLRTFSCRSALGEAKRARAIQTAAAR